MSSSNGAPLWAHIGTEARRAALARTGRDPGTWVALDLSDAQQVTLDTLAAHAVEAYYSSSCPVPTGGLWVDARGATDATPEAVAVRLRERVAEEVARAEESAREEARRAEERRAAARSADPETEAGQAALDRLHSGDTEAEPALAALAEQARGAKARDEAERERARAEALATRTAAVEGYERGESLPDAMDRIQERITAVLRVPHTTDPHVARHAEHLREAADTARDAFGALCKALNGGPREAVVGGLLAGLTTEHRYLVNDAVWALLDALGEWGGGSPRSYTDARNESAHLACREVREALKDRIYWREAK